MISDLSSNNRYLVLLLLKIKLFQTQKKTYILLRKSTAAFDSRTNIYISCSRLLQRNSGLHAVVSTACT